MYEFVHTSLNQIFKPFTGVTFILFSLTKGRVRQKAHCSSDGQMHWVGKAIVMSELL